MNYARYQALRHLLQHHAGEKGSGLVQLQIGERYTLLYTYNCMNNNFMAPCDHAGTASADADADAGPGPTHVHAHAHAPPDLFMALRFTLRALDITPDNAFMSLAMDDVTIVGASNESDMDRVQALLDTTNGTFSFPRSLLQADARLFPCSGVRVRPPPLRVPDKPKLKVKTE